jgi:hypothetical protein
MFISHVPTRKCVYVYVCVCVHISPMDDMWQFVLVCTCTYTRIYTTISVYVGNGHTHKYIHIRTDSYIHMVSDAIYFGCWHTCIPSQCQFSHAHGLVCNSFMYFIEVCTHESSFSIQPDCTHTYIHTNVHADICICTYARLFIFANVVKT